MIEIKEITKSYGSKTIIHNWSYKFENGKIYGLIGRNGIGKTTVMKCVCGLLEPDSIEIMTEQGDVSKLNYLTRNIYFVSDEPTYLMSRLMVWTLQFCFLGIQGIIIDVQLFHIKIFGVNAEALQHIFSAVMEQKLCFMLAQASISQQ